MGGAHELHAPLGDRARGLGFEFGADLVDDDYLGHVVFHRFDHHGVLLGGRGHLHPARPADARVRDVAVAGDLVRRIDDNHPLLELVGQDAGHFAQQRRLTHAGLTQDKDARPALHEVADDVHRPEDRAADATG